MRRAVVEEDDGGRQREGPRGDLHKQHDNDGEPHPDAGRLVRGRATRRGEREVRGKGVGDGEEREEILVALDGAETAVDRRVNGELQRHADDAHDGGRETDTLRRHAQTTREDEGQLLRRRRGIGRVVARRRQEEEPQVVERSHLEIKERLRQQRAQHILGPDPPESQHASRPRGLALFFHLVALGAVDGLAREQAFLLVLLERKLGVPARRARNDRPDSAEEELDRKGTQTGLSLARIEGLDKPLAMLTAE